MEAADPLFPIMRKRTNGKDLPTMHGYAIVAADFATLILGAKEFQSCENLL